MNNKHHIETLFLLLFSVAFNGSIQLRPLWHKNRIPFGVLLASKPLSHSLILLTKLICQPVALLVWLRAGVSFIIHIWERSVRFLRSPGESKHSPQDTGWNALWCCVQLPRLLLKGLLKIDWYQYYWSAILYLHVASLHQTVNHICFVETCSHLTWTDQQIRLTAHGLKIMQSKQLTKLQLTVPYVLSAGQAHLPREETERIMTRLILSLSATFYPRQRCFSFLHLIGLISSYSYLHFTHAYCTFLLSFGVLQIL